MVHQQSIHPEDKGKIIESEPNEVLWRFEYDDKEYQNEEGDDYEEIHRDPQEVLKEGFTRKGFNLITLSDHRNTGFVESQYISTTRDPELWFHERRYRYKIIPSLNQGQASRTGVYVSEDDDCAPHEQEVSFTNKIEPQAIVEVYDKLLNRTGSINGATSQLVWKNGGRFNWTLEDNSPRVQRFQNIVNKMIVNPNPRYSLEGWRREVCGALLYYSEEKEGCSQAQSNTAIYSKVANLAKYVNVNNKILADPIFRSSFNHGPWQFRSPHGPSNYEEAFAALPFVMDDGRIFQPVTGAFQGPAPSLAAVAATPVSEIFARQSLPDCRMREPQRNAPAHYGTFQDAEGSMRPPR
ncbi:hypothetical protein ACFWNK_38570 [Streptomyces sp. NPDC058417]|uniref:hypothetical protein n=1 Tax=unclassified Streptomyces TaxID=2593676 RepID=UPI0036629885